MNRLMRLVALLAVLALVAAACGGGTDDTTTTEGAAGDTTTTEAAETTTTEAMETTTTEGPMEMVPVEVKIGTLLPQTGTLAGIIDALEKPLEMAVEEINGAGGAVELVKSDSGTSPDVATVNVDQLLNDEVDAIIGAAASGVSLSVIDKVTGSQVVQCSPSNTAATFSTYDDGGYYFRTAPSDVLQAPLLGDIVIADGFVDVAVVYRNDEYGAGFAELLEGAITDAGGNIVASVAYDPEATSFDAEVGQVVDAAPEAVVVITFGEGAALLQAMIEAGAGPADIQIYGTDGFKDSVEALDDPDNTTPGVSPDDASVLAGMKGTAPSANPANGEPTFPDRFAAFAPDTPTIFSAQAYDCLVTIVLAAEAAGSADGIAAEMNNVTSGGEKCTTYAECHALLAEGADIDYDGASGPLEFTEAGEPGVGTYDVWEYDAEGVAQTLDQAVAGE